jgi:hypothetical protein
MKRKRLRRPLLLLPKRLSKTLRRAPSPLLLLKRLTLPSTVKTEEPGLRASVKLE